MTDPTGTDPRDAPADTASARAFDLFTEVGIIHQLTAAILASSLPDGLHPSHFAILNHLTRRGDGKTPIRIAEAMQVTKNTMTHSLRVLEGRDLIAVRPNPDDGRGKLVYLTETGKHFGAEAIAEVTARIDSLVTPKIAALFDRIHPDLLTLRKHLDDNRG